MEIFGTWGTEVEVIALATLLKTAIAIYYHLLVQKYLSGITILLCALMLTHQFGFICTILETMCKDCHKWCVTFISCIRYLSYNRSRKHCINYIISLQHQLFPN